VKGKKHDQSANTEYLGGGGHVACIHPGQPPKARADQGAGPNHPSSREQQDSSDLRESVEETLITTAFLQTAPPAPEYEGSREAKKNVFTCL